jgi:hypothetical protein
MRHGIWVAIVILLTLAPVLDLAWNEPVIDGSQEARCLLHATPAAIFAPVAAMLLVAAEVVSPVEWHDCLPLIGPSIFLPPRL